MVRLGVFPQTSGVVRVSRLPAQAVSRLAGMDSRLLMRVLRSSSPSIGPVKKAATDRPQFEPTSQRSPAVVLGALLWVLAIAVVLWVIGHRNAVEIAFVVTFGSILVWVVLLAAGRVRRGRRERET